MDEVRLTLPPPTIVGSAHQPTRRSRRLIGRMVAAGLSRISIAQVVEMSEETLSKYYLHELTTGLDKSIALAERSLYRRGLQGDTTALIFWLKARAKWRDRDQLNVTVINEQKEAPKLESRQVEDAIYVALSRLRPDGGKGRVIENRAIDVKAIESKTKALD